MKTFQPSRKRFSNLLGGSSARGLVVSPYFPRAGGTYKTTYMKAIAGLDYGVSGTGIIGVGFWTGSTLTDAQNLAFDMQDATDALSLIAAAESAINTYATGQGYTLSEGIFWPFPPLPTAPASYQTIVSQTGTTAPAVAGGLTPVSTYPSGTTFTWARTGTGVYTITASTAVFSTSGKTGVFVGALNNLNASYKTVVTSSTVITITTAIGSLLGLGLLGLTATNTDALLSNTMIYVQTYA